MSNNFKRGYKSWCENISIQLRKDLGLKPIDPLDPKLLAKQLNVIVWDVNQVPGLEDKHKKRLLVEDKDSWSALTIQYADKHLIILNTSHSKKRQSSDLMHELSHVFLDHKPSRVDVSDGGLLLNTYDQAQEAEASWLCGSLLLPRQILTSIVYKKIPLRQASDFYDVSMDMLNYRLNVMGVKNQFKTARRRKRN